jgi:hypothetical protein
MKWKVIPREQQPQKMWGILAIGVIVALFAYVLTKHGLVILLGLGVIAMSTAEFWLGTTYSLSDEEAEAKLLFSGSVIKWADVKCVKMDLSHIYLSPFAEEHRLEAFRGVKLNLTNADREQVIDHVRQRVGEDVRFLGG